MATREMISFQRDQTIFNVRVVGVAVVDDHVLLEQHQHWILPGGRLELMEPAAVGLAREMREELGVVVEVGRLLWTVENLWHDQGIACHALEFYFQITLPATFGPAAGGFTHMESDDVGNRWPMVFQWVPLARTVTLELYPLFLRRALLALPAITEHIVNDERVMTAT